MCAPDAARGHDGDRADAGVHGDGHEHHLLAPLGIRVNHKEQVEQHHQAAVHQPHYDIRSTIHGICTSILKIYVSVVLK